MSKKTVGRSNAFDALREVAAALICSYFFYTLVDRKSVQAANRFVQSLFTQPRLEPASSNNNINDGQ